MTKLIALTIGGSGGGPTFNVALPQQLSGVGNLHIQNLVSFILSFVLAVAVLLAFFFFLFGGIRWIISQGDKKQLESAQKTIQYALVGLIVIFLSFFIINLIGFAFDVPLLNVHW